MMGNICAVKIGTVELDNDIRKSKLDKNLNPITRRDRKLLKNSWEEMCPRWSNVCLMAFRRWFASYPEIMKLFSQQESECHTIEELLGSPVILGHIVRLRKMIENVLLHIDEDDKQLTKSLIQLGKQHFEFGATQAYATSFATNLKFSVCTELKITDHEIQNAWDSLFRYLSGLLKLGMRQAKEESTKAE